MPKNYSKFELPVKQGINDIYVSIDIDEVLRINDKVKNATKTCALSRIYTSDLGMSVLQL